MTPSKTIVSGSAQAGELAESIHAGSHGMLLETPQDFFKEIDLHGLLPDLALQYRDALAIQPGLGARPFAGKCQLTFGTPLALPRLQPFGTHLVLTGHFGYALARVQLAHARDLQFA